MAIKGLSASGAAGIVAERERKGEYKSLEDFSRRVKPARDDIVALCPAGVFDSIAAGLPRPMQARQLLSNEKGVRSNEKGVMSNELFEPDHSSLLIPNSSLITHSSFLISNYLPHSPLPTPYSLQEEYRALGFLRHVHPLALWKDRIALLKRIRAKDMAEYTGRHVKLLGWPITQKEVWTKDGLTMSFLSFEDETALYETVIFPEMYDRYNKLLFDQQPLLVSGMVSEDEGAITLEVRKI